MVCVLQILHKGMFNYSEVLIMFFQLVNKPNRDLETKDQTKLWKGWRARPLVIALLILCKAYKLNTITDTSAAATHILRGLSQSQHDTFSIMLLTRSSVKGHGSLRLLGDDQCQVRWLSGWMEIRNGSRSARATAEEGDHSKGPPSAAWGWFAYFKSERSLMGRFVNNKCAQWWVTLASESVLPFKAQALARLLHPHTGLWSITLATFCPTHHSARERERKINKTFKLFFNIMCFVIHYRATCPSERATAN